MKGKKTKVEEGITYEVYKEVEDPGKNAEENPEKKEEESKKEILNSEEVKTIFVQEVVREPKMKYYKVPRLGCYFVCALSYNSYLNEESFDEAIENYRIYLEKINQQEAEKEAKRIEVENEMKNAEEEGTEYVPEPIEWEKIEEPPYQSKPINFVLCLDTLGQDRVFMEEEKKICLDLVKFISKSWEEKEKNQLTDDKLLKTKSDELSKEYIEKDMEIVNENLEKNVEEYLANLEGEIKEEEKNIKHDHQKIKELTKIIVSGSINEQILEMKKYRVNKFARLFQNLFYFLNFDRELICEPETNKLYWKVAKDFINEDLFKKMEEYTPLGPKQGKLPRYKLLNTIEKNLEEYNEDDLLKYSVALYMIHKWLNSQIELRKSDIAYRKAIREKMLNERDEALKKETERKEKRDEALEIAINEAKQKWESENPISRESEAKGDKNEERSPNEKKPDEEEEQPPEFSFDEEGFLKQWDEENPEVIIPPEVPEEFDDDYEIEIK